MVEKSNIYVIQSIRYIFTEDYIYMTDIKYKRIVLKLSGEALAGDAGHG